MQRARHIINRLCEAPGLQATVQPTQQRQVIVRPAEPKADGVITQEFLSYIKGVENPQRIGWDKTKKRWFPHKDPSGGFNIGYGHHFQSNEEYARYKEKGMSNSEVEALLVQDIVSARKTVQNYIQRRYRVNIQLTPHQEQMLVDYVFNSGGLEKFPKMVDAILRFDKDKMRQEYKRFATIGGAKKELTGRNQQFAANFMRESSHVA